MCSNMRISLSRPIPKSSAPMQTVSQKVAAVITAIKMRPMLVWVVYIFSCSAGY